MYSAIREGDDLAQGDVIRRVVFAYVPNSAPQLFDATGNPTEADPKAPWNPEERLAVLGEARISPAIILSQSCDVLHRPFLTVARVFPLEAMDLAYARLQAPAKRVAHLYGQYQRAGVRPGVFYLREAPAQGFPKSLASFLEIHTLRNDPATVDYLKANRILRLTGEAVQDLQFRLGYFFGRFAVEDEYMLTDEEKQLRLE